MVAPPRQRHGARTGTKRVAGRDDRDQRGRARGLDRHARPGQPEPIGHCRGEVVAVAADQVLQVFRVDALLGEPKQTVAGIRRGDSRRPTHRPTRASPPPRAYIRRPRTLASSLQEQPVLRARRGGLCRRQSERRGIEQIDTVDGGGELPVSRLPGELSRDAIGVQLCVLHRTDGLAPLQEVLPERIRSVRAGKPARHSDDGYALVDRSCKISLRCVRRALHTGFIRIRPKPSAENAHKTAEPVIVSTSRSPFAAFQPTGSRSDSGRNQAH